METGGRGCLFALCRLKNEDVLGRAVAHGIGVVCEREAGSGLLEVLKQLV